MTEQRYERLCRDSGDNSDGRITHDYNSDADSDTSDNDEILRQLIVDTLGTRLQHNKHTTHLISQRHTSTSNTHGKLRRSRPVYSARLSLYMMPSVIVIINKRIC